MFSGLNERLPYLQFGPGEVAFCLFRLQGDFVEGRELSQLGFDFNCCLLQGLVLSSPVLFLGQHVPYVLGLTGDRQNAKRDRLGPCPDLGYLLWGNGVPAHVHCHVHAIGGGGYLEALPRSSVLDEHLLLAGVLGNRRVHHSSPKAIEDAWLRVSRDLDRVQNDVV